MTRVEPTFGEPTFDPHKPETPSETFCTYLAKQLIAKKGFELAQIPEAEPLRSVCDGILTRSDGYALGILCMVDREAHPDATFRMGVEQLEAISQSCLKYTGQVNRRKMPVTVGVIEVGPGSYDQQQRLQGFQRASLSAKVVPFAMVVDTVSGQVWNNRANLISKGPYADFAAKLLAAPRETGLDFAPPVVAVAPPSLPFLTSAILLVLAAVFAAEIAFGIGPWTGPLQPTNATLIAFGGMERNLVLQSGQWYRLLSAPFLHVDAGHIAMNMIALFVAGRVLEFLIGRAWLGAIYVVSALAGSLLSLALNPPLIISVGASGAIMGLFAAMLVISLHFPTGPIRTNLQMNAMYVLIPSLLPLAGALNGQKVDYAAHFGGAIGGALLGLVVLALWSRNEKLPALRQVAAALAIAGVVALIYPAASILQAYQNVAFVTELVPAAKFPKTDADLRIHATELIAQYPHDPRPRFFRAADLLDTNDLAGAEREARAALAEEDRWRSLLPPQFDNSLRAVLALAIADRHEEALRTASPACEAIKDGPMRKLLDERKLCGT